ncbi:hypothetical protein H257_17938 [Aphanomyces astaci]|uniref:Uncharacterized protein n=1 Tax=Aphanomyces astaci TaxID=112090 RepID=W4FEY0_APHAT|nr:hypothetical protein H257_17938 [Aphanomyces astaci]ETV65283.1 hypothetical protein H257_17938 [Aphanomyces astaci]|eukprot:XP_009845209.1 hypothetical protein H257_17938 [Aphanomyces astaci]
MATAAQRESSTLEDILGAPVAERSKKAYASGIRQPFYIMPRRGKGWCPASTELMLDKIELFLPAGHNGWAKVADGAHSPENKTSRLSNASGGSDTNLMARSKSIETIQLSHFTYEEGAIGGTLFNSKTVQDGSKRRDPRHVYANVLQPHICVFLTLGL